MNNLNSVLIEGNLVRDPELAYTPKGTAACKFSVACNRSFKQDQELQKEVSYFDVSTYARLAEICAEYLKKGRGVRVVGRLKQDKWTDTEGNTRYKVYIVAEHVEFKPQIKAKDPAAEGTEDKSEESPQEEQEEVKEAVSF